MNEKEMIDKIEFLINKIFIIWCEMKNNDMNKLQEIWKGLESNIYTSKFTETEQYINKIIEELENLKNTWYKYIILKEKEKNL